jgi:hypothetical protein
MSTIDLPQIITVGVGGDQMPVRNSKPARARQVTYLTAAAAAIALLAPASLVYAKSWQSPGGWEIYDDDDNCSIFREFEGKGATHLLLILFADGGSGASLTNTAWSTAKDEKYDLTWDVNGSVYTGTAFGLGDKYASRKGFGGKFGNEFIDDVALGDSLHVYRGDVVVDQLALDGSGAAIAIARRCLQTVKATIAAAEREKRRFSHIADDPFADPK